MTNKSIITAVLMDEHTTISLVDVCQTCDISEELLLEMMEQGLFNHHARSLETTKFNLKMLSRIQTARRLQRDLDINLAGVVLILDLLDEIAELRDEVSVLQRHVDRG